jgi:hypothetical protein
MKAYTDHNLSSRHVLARKYSKAFSMPKDKSDENQNNMSRTILIGRKFVN